MVKNTHDTIMEFIMDRFPLAKKKGVSDDTPLLENGILDSLGVLDLIEFIEGKFAIGVNDDDLLPENFRSLTEIVAFVQQRSGALSS